MKYFYIHPVDIYSPSKRWITDEFGLEAIKHRYENYDKDPDNLVNRWSDFVVEETKEVRVDFGGMYCAAEPEVRFRDGESFYSMQVSHLPFFVDSLKKPQKSDRYKGAFYIPMWNWHLCLSHKTIKRILPLARKLNKNCQEMQEGVERDWTERIDQINKMGGNLFSIRIQPPEDDNE